MADLNRHPRQEIRRRACLGPTLGLEEGTIMQRPTKRSIFLILTGLALLLFCVLLLNSARMVGQL
jgi:hypothetical protein